MEALKLKFEQAERDKARADNTLELLYQELLELARDRDHWKHLGELEDDEVQDYNSDLESVHSFACSSGCGDHQLEKRTSQRASLRRWLDESCSSGTAH
jgi:hypothetical protein